MKKFSELSEDTLLFVENDCPVIEKKEIEEDISNGYTYKELYIAEPIYASFNLENALEMIQDGMHEDWLEDTLNDITEEEKDEIEDKINSMLSRYPSYIRGEKVEIKALGGKQGMDYKKLADTIRSFESIELLAAEIESLVVEGDVESLDELTEFLENELEYSSY